MKLFTHLISNFNKVNHDQLKPWLCARVNGVEQLIDNGNSLLTALDGKKVRIEIYIEEK